MWDVAIVMALAYPQMATETQAQSPHDNHDRPIQVYTKVDVEAMKTRFWELFDKFLAG